MIKSFLSVEIWQPLQKLTFLMYITHPIIGYWYVKAADIPAYYSIWSGTANICTMVTATAVFSFLLYLFMEQPIALFIYAAFKRILGRSIVPYRVSLKGTNGELLSVIKHHPSTGTGTVDVEPSISRSDLDMNHDDETGTDNGMDDDDK